MLRCKRRMEGQGPLLMQQASERALLTGLLARLRALDPDALVGHNLTAFDLDVLLHRLQAHKVRFSPRPDRAGVLPMHSAHVIPLPQECTSSL